MEPQISPIRLTQLAHGGGCGCKLEPATLRSLLERQRPSGPFEKLLVGTETSDDAAVWDLDGQTCIVATTDFFMPMVDDPFDFGRIAATNAISDIYAMGAKPIMALAILGMPVGKIDVGAVSLILQGGADICAQAGIPVAGGHSIDNPEPVYGLAVIGLCSSENVRRNAAARAGDVLLLTKPLGVGVYSAAIRAEKLSSIGYAEFIASTTQLNRMGIELGRDPQVHALTDVTGFGLLGHCLELARGADVRVVLEWASIPLLKQAAHLVQGEFVTGASHRNWRSYGEHVSLPPGLTDWQRHLLTDPQTSGGLLIACSAERADALVDDAKHAGFSAAARIGFVEAGSARVELRLPD